MSQEKTAGCLLEVRAIMLNAQDLRSLLPHRGEAIRIIDSAFYDPTTNGSEIVAYKKLTRDDPYFIGHFPEKPVYPGHWQIESMCLASALLCKLMNPCMIGNPAFIGLEGKTQFKRPIIPGDSIEIHASFIETLPVRGGGLKYVFSASIERDNKTVSSIERILGGIFPENI